MELYGEKSKSIPQKTTIVFIELLLLALSCWILFMGGGTIILQAIGLHISEGNYYGRVTIFIFSVIVFCRMSFMMFYLLKRKMPWEEVISVPFAFALYYIGYALLGYGRELPFGWLDYFGILLFIVGSSINTTSELLRDSWKKHPENKGKLYTKGLFRYSMHINYFGDILWVSAYAIITRNVYSILIPIFLVSFFVFYNIPKLDSYLAKKYKDEFERYRLRTKKLVPFIY